jgi:hypothetical protein
MQIKMLKGINAVRIKEADRGTQSELPERAVL